MTASIDPERMRRQAKLHALPVGWEQLDYATFLDRRRSLMAQVVRDGFSLLWGATKPTREATIEDLIAAGESQTLEFKSSARWNMHLGDADPKLEHLIVKTVCGFLNAEGGVLLIGVNDEGQALGLDHDLSTLDSKPNLDGYELFLRQLLDTNLATTTAATVRMAFPSVGPTPICSVTVAPPANRSSPSPPRRQAHWVKSSGSASATRPNNSTVTTSCNTGWSTGAEPARAESQRAPGPAFRRAWRRGRSPTRSGQDAPRPPRAA